MLTPRPLMTRGIRRLRYERTGVTQRYVRYTGSPGRLATRQAC